MQISNPRTPNPNIIDEFYILDLDRCLANTEKLQSFLQQIIERELDVTSDELNMARREYESEGGSFDTALYIVHTVDGRGGDGPEVWHRVKDMFITEAQMQDMFEPHASELLRELDKRKKKYGIVTFGGDAWQLSKIAAAGLNDVPHMVTHEQEKGRIIASWQQADGSFLIPLVLAGGRSIVAKRLFFVDDKPVSFAGVPHEVIAVCVIAPGATWPDQTLKRLPSNVTVVDGMQGVVNLLFR